MQRVARRDELAAATAAPRRRPPHVPATRVETLQRSAGNAAVGALARDHRHTPAVVGRVLRTPGAMPRSLLQVQRRGCGPSCSCAPCAAERDEAPEAVQRAGTATKPPGEVAAGGHLTSPRFASHPELEACFEDRARLGIGAKGPAVAAVQQALADRGHDIGPAGADADYGSRTAAAVRDFKRKERLGFEQFGDVGPGTMHRLDELFPPEEKPDLLDPDVAEDETGSCPFEPDIVTAAVNRGDDATASASESLVGAPDQIGAGNHLDIPDAIKLFKQRVNASDNKTHTDPDTGRTSATDVTDRGQFFWASHMMSAVIDELADIGGDAADADGVEFRRVGRDLCAKKKALEPGTAELGVLTGIAARTSSPKKGRMFALLAPARLGAGALEQLLWSQLNNRPDASLPDLASHRSFAVLGALARFDKTSCGTHALLMADRLKRRGGLVPRDPSARGFGAFLAAGTAVRDRRPRPPGSENHIGDVIRQTGVLGAVAQAQHALDGGMVVHARVLSGQGYGIQHGVKSEARAVPTPLGPPPEEHSLLLIGFDASNFVFSDPDAGVSHDPENGFGMLHLDLANDRFGTATNEEDLVVTPEGFHASRNQKRYQVISLSSV